VIYLHNKDQQDAIFALSLFQ